MQVGHPREMEGAGGWTVAIEVREITTLEAARVKRLAAPSLILVRTS